MLGVTEGRVWQLQRDHASFPEPLDVIAAGKIWLESDIIDWAQLTNRPVRPRDA